MIFINDGFEQTKGIVCLGRYRGYRKWKRETGAPRELFDAFSNKILQVKDRQPYSIEFFFDILDYEIAPYIGIACVPPHAPYDIHVPHGSHAQYAHYAHHAQECSTTGAGWSMENGAEASWVVQSGGGLSGAGETGRSFHLGGSLSGTAEQERFMRMGGPLPGVTEKEWLMRMGGPLSGIGVLAKKLALSDRIDLTGCLVRTKEIEKLSAGGCRSKKVHLESIAVAQPEEVVDRDILIIDDISTTGNSLYACRDFLMRAGARRVAMLALGQTEGESARWELR